MNPARRLLLSVTAIVPALAIASSAVAEVQRYHIDPGGQYTYLPSGEGPGIPGCDPSDFECAFGIDGTFSVDYDRDADTAKLIDLGLLLLGNEEVKDNPPGFVPVTAGRVADWLADRLFRQLPAAGPFDLYADETFPELHLTDFLNGTISLIGGYDARFVDGDGVEFNLTAMVVPEPSCGAMAGGAVLLAFALGGRRPITL